MPDVCTCGAVLPPDARFCHKCGKPQRDEPLLVEEAPAQRPVEPPGLAAPPAPPRIGIRNGLAVRVALLAWCLTFAGVALGGLASLPQVLAIFWLPVGGFLAVYLYRRRTGQRVSVKSGAQLGWLCGIFGFIMATLGLALNLADPATTTRMAEQLQSSGVPAASVSEWIVFFRSPVGVLVVLISLFLVFTLLPAFGGALGAKLLDRD